MRTPSSRSEQPHRQSEGDVLSLPMPLPPAPIPASLSIAEGVRLLRSSASLPAVEVVKRPHQSAALLAAYVSEGTEFSLLYDGRDSAAFRSYFNKNLRHHGFPREVCSDLTDHISRLFEDFRDATLKHSVESFLILRRPRARAHWHIDHYRPDALQFVTTLAGYPTTPFLLPEDYNRSEFERYHRKLLERQIQCGTLSSDDEVLLSLKTEMSRLGEEHNPRFVRGDLLFKGDDLFHASPQSPVSRLLFAMTAV